MSEPLSKSRTRPSRGVDPLAAPDAYAGVYDFDVEADENSLIDDLIDDLVPPDVNWRRLVRRHPWPALLAVGLSGYLLGRSQGRTLIAAIAGMAAARAEESFLGTAAAAGEADSD